MAFWSRWFGSEAKKPVKPRADMLDRADVSSGLDAALNELVGGYLFCATMQLRTPARVLRRHGEIHRDLGVPPPRIAAEQWEGIWIPVLEGQDSLFGQMASEVGPIPADGGPYLPFLLAVRSVVEAEGTAGERRERLGSLLDDRRWREFVAAHGGADGIADSFFPLFLATVGGLPKTTIAALVDRGWDTPEALARVGDRDLLAIGGIGPAKLRAIRSACAGSPAPSERFADVVRR